MHFKIIVYLIGFWPSNRKEKKEKKDEKKRSNNSKPNPKAQLPQQHDETASVNSHNSASETNDFNKMMGSMEGLDRISSSISKGKCVINSVKIFFRLIYFFIFLANT